MRAFLVAQVVRPATGPELSAAVRAPAVVVLLDAKGERRTLLWEAADLAPVALEFGDGRIIIGTRGPKVFDGSGQPVRTLPATTSPFRLDLDANSARVVVAEHAQLSVWDLASGEALGTRRGTWVDAALTPDGTRVVAVDFTGHLPVHRVDADLPVAGEVPADAPVLTVAATDDRLVAAFPGCQPCGRRLLGRAARSERRV